MPDDKHQAKQRLVLTYRFITRTRKWCAVIREHGTNVPFMVGTERFEGMHECHAKMKRLFAAFGCELEDDDILMQVEDD